MSERATIDFESRSACPIRTHGSWVYSLHETTEVLCMAFRLPDWGAGRVALWHPAFPHLGIEEPHDNTDLFELLGWIASGNLVEAHNAFFERGIWANILVARFGWPVVAENQWRCSAAKAAAHALPRALDEATQALKLSVLKDTEGEKIMKKLAKPRKPRKKEREDWAKLHGDAPMPLLWWESVALFERLWAYCKQDVLAEECLSGALDDLNPLETQMYLLDQRVNERGFQIDQEAVTAALSLIARETVALNKELRDLTGGQVQKATQRAQMLQWLGENGLDLDDTQAGTIDDTLVNGDLTPPVRKCLEIMRALGRSSTAKYQRMRDWMGPDGRVRGGLLYHGASTGRWSGKGVQPHNLPKGTVRDANGKPPDVNHLWSVLKTQQRSDIMSHFGGVMEALSQGLRGAIIAKPGLQLYVADYAAIEARVVLWLAGDQDALGIFRRGEDIYKDMAASIYKIPMAAVTKDQRQLGKVAILGLSYQMGAPKFHGTCANFGIHIEEELAQTTVEAYRAKFWRVKDLWNAQQAAAIEAVQGGETVRCGRVEWFVEDTFLYCELPGGRRLAYPEPEVRIKMTPWGEPRPSLTFMGQNPFTRKWCRQTTYGGSLVENLTQGIARNILAEAMLALENSGLYQLVLTCHDETMCEGAASAGMERFNKIMTTVPKWADGLPIAVDSWTGPRYKKD